MLNLKDASQELKDYLGEYQKINKGIDQELTIIEREYKEEGYLVSEVKVNLNNTLIKAITNKHRLDDDGKERVGGIELKDLNKYMYRMFHPKYKSYIVLQDYIKRLKKEGKLSR